MPGGAASRVRGSWNQSSNPGRLVALPEVFEDVAVAQRVHRLPEALVAVDRHLPARGQLAHRPLLPHRRLVVDEPAGAGLEHEEAAVGPGAVAARLLLEGDRAVAVHVQRAEAT